MLFFLSASALTLYPDDQTMYLIKGAVFFSLLVLHIFAFISWEYFYLNAKVLSIIAGMLLLLAFPLDTIVGIIMLYQMNKFKYDQPAPQTL